MRSNQPLRDLPGRSLRRARPRTDLEEPILGELFSVERLEQHAQTLAAAQAVTDTPRRGLAIRPRVEENGRVLLDSYRLLARAIKDERAITPAAEWLVDNFHIVEEQLREIRDDLPPDYYDELPKLAEGHLAGYPRVLGIAWAYVAHTDSRFEPETLRRMVQAYQTVQPLTLGELWAIAITLRILLVDNLRRLAEQIVRSREARQVADELADDLVGLGDGGADEAAASLRRLRRTDLPTASRVQLFQRLRDQDPAVTPALQWLDEVLAAEGTTAEEMVRLEHQRQATMNVTVRNVITSMRLISSFDWASFVESVSLVDEVLRERSAFAAMDFATRDRYRHAVEELARRSGQTEIDVAREAAAMAGAGSPADDDAPIEAARRRDPGFFLISDGRPALELALDVQVPLAGRLRRNYVRSAAGGYLGTIALATAVILAVPLALARGEAEAAALLVMAVLALVPASDLAIALVNRAVTGVMGPRPLPRLDLDDGVPAELRTLVVVPTLLTSEADVEAQVGGLEVHYLGNRDGDLRFALLSDWLDAPSEHVPGDDELLGAAVAAIDRLNARHGEAPGGGARFLLFHRARRWNEAEGRWMGWERKRGKLHELNDLLCGSTMTSIVATGRPSSTPPPDVRFVVTLDADTKLPRGAVGRLVGTIAHPLNRPTFDEEAGRVTRGYGVLQPRITSTLPVEHEASVFQAIYSGSAGIDPYASAVSDVYQDLFGEGSFTGKGIYDLDAFSTSMADRVPDNTLLSHDLFEGIYARAGLVTDVELFDEFPSNYLVSVARQHRWARGDWQLLPWILGRARDATGSRARSAMPPIARWKMIDNLRRTLSAPLTLATLVAAWTIPSVPTLLWTGFVLAALVIPAALPVLPGLLPRRKGISKRSHLRAVGADIALAAAHVGLGLAFLAHQAWLMMDAIGRTLARLLVTRRNLLEWMTAAQAKASHDLALETFYRQMAGGVAIALATAALVVIFNPGAAPIAGPFIVLWIIAPAVARWVSLPPPESAAAQLAPSDVVALRHTARRTWRFFETFVGPADNHLPPDNFQDDPAPVVAHRTSPTNIGMYLLATVTARDFGWIGTLEMVDRLEATLATVGRLEGFRGHLYNWYDTRDLSRLEPGYVSSVDSGNLAGHLITLSSACRQIIEQPLPVAAALAGIEDAVALTREAAFAIGDERRTQTITRRHLDEALLAPPDEGPEVPATAAAWAARLSLLASHARTLSDVAAALTAERGEDADGELVTWAEAAGGAIGSHARDLSLVDTTRSDEELPTLAELADPSLRGDDDRTGSPAAKELVRRLRAIADDAQRLFAAMDFAFLFDPTRKLFSIGFRVRDGMLDPSYYDLLASEARLTSFLAIAKGDVGPDHWFRLGRALTPVGRGSALISWSGSMFEYLMPALVMRAPIRSLLDHTYQLVVARQMSYAAELGVPWGMSESAFNARDLEQTYQYSSFGVPGLGLKRGLSEDVVVAPYATALGAMVEPQAAIRNFARLRDAGASGPYGFREALDYTARRVPEGATVAVVKSWMAHHQGMALVAIGNVVNGNAMVERFHADPLVEATELLLQERVPRDVLVARPRAEEVKSVADVRDLVPPVLRRFTSPHDAIPRTHLLSNGRYAVMVTAAGSGYSRWRDLAVTRWREDVTRDSWGSYLFLRDMQSGAVWSAGHQPSGAEADSYEVTYSEDHAEFARRDGSIATGLTIVVSAEHDAEIRRVSLTNLGSQAREIELTSYAEVVLAPQAADVAHPAFQNLFVQTEFVPEIGALLATRRPRSRDEAPIWAAHVAAVEEGIGGVIQYETDRARFLGRTRSVHAPISVIDGRPLSNTVGPVLDPIFSLRCRVRLAPGSTVHATFSTVIAESREDVLDLADKYREAATFERAATLAWTQAQVQLHHLGIDADEAHLFQRLANRILYSDPSLRPAPGLLAKNERGAPGLWAHGISGDLPIVLVRIDEVDDLEIVRQLLRAHEYWRLKLLDVDLVILNEHGATYAEILQDALEALVRTSQSTLADASHPRRGAVYILRGDRLSTEDRTLLQAAARAVLLSRRGTLSDQVVRLERPERPVRPATTARTSRVASLPVPRPELEFFNGLGGFAEDGREYVAVLGPGQSTPAPWLNVIANAEFGFQVSESGSGYTWSGNSRENQLTPWSNDPVSDPVGEAIYVRDDESGELWGPTALPIRHEESTYVASHGAGYSRFEHLRDGIELRLLQLVPLEDRLKVSVLRIHNQSGRPRRLSITAYAEWVLGPSRASGVPSIVSDREPETGALLARNPWNTEFAGRVAFLDLAGRQTAWTADRTEFLGRNGAPDRPAGLERGHRLRGTIGAGLDPCAALQTSVELPAGAQTEVIVLLGEADSVPDAVDLIRRGRAADHEATLQAVARWWDDTHGTVQVRTPDRSMDIMLNRWLIYQALACRLWARTGLYQAGGAYGFRDQLQDVIALVTPRRELARRHLLLAAAHQFVEGDVQHWWHPPSGRGVRTRISDDRLWLPYAVDRYLATTGDVAILEEPVPYLEGPALRPGETDAYFQPERSATSGTLYEHCAAALDRSLALGAHGLPFIGSGDWNDGMNRVGHEGRGESVWLGWFLHTTLAAFATIAERRDDGPRAERWRATMKRLRRALERDGWDGDWYRRAFFDDGTPLGSSLNAECRIDSIAQSWSVISGAADPARAERAMAAVEEYLVRRGDGLVLLFSPPFDRSEVDPGYIKGYLPGIRENGGQYTHGAIWSVLAYAALGDGDKAGELFSILNPINHASTRAGVHRYKVEPYVMAADIYAEFPHVGRGGWTWYTGSAGWMYQAGIEAILGFHLRGERLELEPCIPRAWPGYEIDFRYHSSRYEIVVQNPNGVSRGVASIELDGVAQSSGTSGIQLADDGATHRVLVVLGPA